MTRQEALSLVGQYVKNTRKDPSCSKKIKAVIFDCGNVLHQVQTFHIKKDISFTLAVNIETVEKLWEKLVPQFRKGKIIEKEFWQKFLKQSGSKKSLPKESLFVRELRKRYKVYDDVTKLVYRLKKKGVKLAVLSNTIVPHVNFLRSKGLFKPFNVKVFSNEVGLEKPDKKIYLLTLKKLKTEPEETVFIDDRPAWVEPAKKLGVKGILFKNASQLKGELTKLGAL